MKTDRWVACQELERGISLLIDSITRKYDVGIKTDAHFDKGKISIAIRDLKKQE